MRGNGAWGGASRQVSNEGASPGQRTASIDMARPSLRYGMGGGSRRSMDVPASVGLLSITAFLETDEVGGQGSGDLGRGEEG